MSRAQRLLDLLQLLRRHRYPVSGAKLAAELGISLRTLYRDIASLQQQGAQIDGEPGMGYVLRPGFMLPPLMFSAEEIEALVLGSRWVAERADSRLAGAARNALAKIGAVLPPELRHDLDCETLLVGPGEFVAASDADLVLIRQAIRREHKLLIDYRDEQQRLSQRWVWPVALAFFDHVRVLAEGLVEAGRVDEAVLYFEKAMAIDPSNSKARELLSATQSRVMAMGDGDDPGRARSALDSSLDLSSSSKIPLMRHPSTAADYLHGTISNFERQDSEEALTQIVNNYQDILSVNPQNAAVRLKLADVHEQIGQISSMLHQLSLASEIFFNKNELSSCVAACERFLRVNPGDQRIRKRMNDAILKRDAYKAIESALMYPDMPDDAGKKKS